MLKITATELPRFMACNGVRLMGKFAEPENLDKTVSEEGNAAHWLVEQVHSKQFIVEELVDRKAPNGIYIEHEMVEYLEDYLKDVQTVDQGTLIEHDTSYGVEGSNSWLVSGRGDFLNYWPQETHLLVADLKYGWSIVEPNNWTLISHAVGWIYKNPDKPVSHVTLRIYQPRPHHHQGRIRSVTFTYAEIMQKGQEIAEAMANPDNRLNTSEHCKNCRARFCCPAMLKAGYNAIEASTEAFVDNPSNEDLSFRLDQLERAQKVLEQLHKAYQDEGLARIKKGQVIDNYGVVKDYGTLAWEKGTDPEMIKAMTGRDDVVKEKLITPTQAKKAGVPEDFVHAFASRPLKGIKLVKQDVNKKAQETFNQPTERN